jgi:hypothetical protein
MSTATPRVSEELEQFRRRVDAAVADVAHEERTRIHPDLLRMPLVVLALSNAAMTAVGEAQLKEFLRFCVRAGLHPGKTVSAVLVHNPATGKMEIEPRIEFGTLANAEAITLPGEPNDFEGMGGQPIGYCPDGILRGVTTWITRPDRPNRRITYARLAAAIDHVLRARRDAVAPIAEDLP